MEIREKKSSTNSTCIQLEVFEISDTVLCFQKMLHTKVEYMQIITKVGMRQAKAAKRLCLVSTCRVYGARPKAFAQ